MSIAVDPEIAFLNQRDAVEQVLKARKISARYAYEDVQFDQAPNLFRTSSELFLHLSASKRKVR